MTAPTLPHLQLTTARELTIYYAYAHSTLRTAGIDAKDPFTVALTAAAWRAVTDGNASLIPTPAPVPQNTRACVVHRAREDDPLAFLLREARQAVREAEATRRHSTSVPIAATGCRTPPPF